jgi:uncharacterized LabA/DUF88 family protein
MTPRLSLCARSIAKVLRAQNTGFGRCFLFTDEKMRTTIYIDGQNLYFSCLKGTAYKWLDLDALLAGIVRAQCHESDVIAIRYFTSLIKGSFSPGGQRSCNAQAEYIRALKCNPLISVIEGRFSAQSIHALRHAIPPDHSNRVRIWRLEEKETDVSIAVEMYRDARDGRIDQIVLVSNDSDLAPALRFVREDTDIRIGVILPLRCGNPDEINLRRPSVSLGSCADWIRPYILDTELASSELPTVVQTKRRPARKPSHW